MEFLYQYNLNFKNMIAILNISSWEFNVMFIIYSRFIVSEARPMI